MLGELNEALDRAEADGAAVLLTGREGRFSAGFDLPVLRAGGERARLMVRAGFELALRVLSFPTLRRRPWPRGSWTGWCQPARWRGRLVRSRRR
jgi:hypothetical protein